MFITLLVLVVGVLFYGESMDWVKIGAMLLAICGRYDRYQNYLDEAKHEKTENSV